MPAPTCFVLPRLNVRVPKEECHGAGMLKLLAEVGSGSEFPENGGMGGQAQD